MYLRASRLCAIQAFLLEQPYELQTEGSLVFVPALGVRAVEAGLEVLGFEQEVDLLEETGLVAVPEDDVIEVEDACAAELRFSVVRIEGVARRAAAGVAVTQAVSSCLGEMVLYLPEVRLQSFSTHLAGLQVIKVGHSDLLVLLDIANEMHSLTV